MRLIDADAVIDRYYADWEYHCINMSEDDRQWLRQCIDQAPTIDAEPVKHGQWEETIISYHDCVTDEEWDEFYYEHKECGYQSEYKHNFCPYCGADLREREEA